MALLGVRDVAVAVNKMDLVDYSEQRFREIEPEFRSFAEPDRARRGSPASRSRRCAATTCSSEADAMPWYHGPTLMGYLETVEVDRQLQSPPFRMPVQWVNRPNLDFRGFAGTIASGTIRAGDRIVIAPSGTQTPRRADRHLRRRPRPARSPGSRSR